MIGRTEDFSKGTPFNQIYQPSALSDPFTESWVPQIRLGLIQRRNRKLV